MKTERLVTPCNNPHPGFRLLCGVRAGLALAAVALGMPALAAGGHHAVDDANMLDEGQCNLEVWAERETGGARTLLHGGPGCRVGPVELDLNIDREKFTGMDGATSFSPQVKWATSLNEQLAVGLVVGSRFNNQSPRYAGSTLYIPVTWRAGDTLSLHANWGRDFQRIGPNQARGGLALEWAPVADWSFIAERFLQSGSSSARAGVRWAFKPGLSLDISRARTLGPGGPSWTTVGVNWQFGGASKPADVAATGPGLSRIP